MRYKIIDSEVLPSILIDAPYDTKQDAKDAVSNGVYHSCEYCMYENDLNCQKQMPLTKNPEFI